MPVKLPPDRTARQQVWHRQYDPSLTSAAPSYPRAWGRLMAGLMMAQPPRFGEEAPDSFPLTVDDLADYTETMVAEAAALGVSYARPIKDDGIWFYEVLPANLVHAKWSASRMGIVSAFDWKTYPNKDNTLLVLQETWVDGTVVSELWEVPGNDKTTHVTLDGNPIASNKPGEERSLSEAHPLYDDMWNAQVRDEAGEERRIVPFVWSFINGTPAPLHAGNEGAVDGIIKLWDQEQQDAEMARNRIAMREDLMGTHDIRNQHNGEMIARAGWDPDSNILLLAPGMTAQDVSEGGVETITFPDSIIQRERIERKENGVLEACGISPQSVGRNVGGRSDSAAAKRADQQMTTTTITGPARRWSTALGDIVTQVATLNGQSDPGVLVFDGFRTTLGERAETVNQAMLSDSMSAYTRVAYLHPEWSDEQINDEVDLLRGEGLVGSPPE